jgi:hypothetical protein
MEHLRLLAFGCLGIAAIVLTNMTQRAGGADAANHWLVVLLNGVVGLFAAAVIADTVWHAMKGKGQACRRCGHLRPMSSFRLYGSCPNCGK